MQFLDFDKPEAISPADHRAQTPNPWINPRGLLGDDAFETLRQNLLPLDLCESSFGVQRGNKQQAHDRYVLEYHKQMPVAPVWHAFIRELRGERYAAVVCRMINQSAVVLNFYWHDTRNGCEVSPHADSIRNARPHIFYFNAGEDWEDSWGVRPVNCPDGKFRKVLIVVVNRDRWPDRLRRKIKRSKFQYF